MKIQDFLQHHGISRNPFAEEDAQTDNVFKKFCIDSIYHVGWDKIVGDPKDPATSIVFGEKGAGKTALRLQISRHVEEYNRGAKSNKLFVINYDDFNPFLDRFRSHFGGRYRRPDKLLGAWRLWDHMDAIMSIGVTKLIDRVIAADKSTEAILTERMSNIDPHQRRDLMLLAACYDESSQDSLALRWKQLGKKLGYATWKSYGSVTTGIVGSLVVAGLYIAQYLYVGEGKPLNMPSAPYWVFLILLILSWLPLALKAIRRYWLAASVSRHLRVQERSINPLFGVLMKMPTSDLQGQTFPVKDRTDDRYALLGKFQNVLDQLGYSGILVLLDRLDEPHLINGQAELMRTFLWPILDNKFLKHPGIGIKMMLPIEIRRFIDREDRDFYQRARLDKQDLVPSLQWTGEALYDLANSRIKACAIDGQDPTVREMFDSSISDQRLIEGFRGLRVPRHLFKFLYRLLVAHCNAYTDDHPEWQVTNHMFESTLAVYSKEIEASDLGTGI